ncbi:hypothetical protein NPIL_354731 [Nephila pilipes]|uniref:Uncharacterized protein n=1 Tax=Nephila pilipes TaxID=299642 RepID=A0A8X6JYA0_NEPPI|nr:hypothetical protein NPIL_354731 [Nephila pilipes]
MEMEMSEKLVRSGDLSPCKPRIGRPHALDDEALPAAIEEDNGLAYGEHVPESFEFYQKEIQLAKQFKRFR